MTDTATKPVGQFAMYKKLGAAPRRTLTVESIRQGACRDMLVPANVAITAAAIDARVKAAAMKKLMMSDEEKLKRKKQLAKRKKDRANKRRK